MFSLPWHVWFADSDANLQRTISTENDGSVFFRESLLFQDWATAPANVLAIDSPTIEGL
jgi:hypothetical protein